MSLKKLYILIKNSLFRLGLGWNKMVLSQKLEQTTKQQRWGKKWTVSQPLWRCFLEQTCVVFSHSLYLASSSCVFLILCLFFLFVLLVYVLPSAAALNSALWTPVFGRCYFFHVPLLPTSSHVWLLGVSSTLRSCRKTFFRLMNFTSLSPWPQRVPTASSDLHCDPSLGKTSHLTRHINCWTAVPLQYSISVNDLSLGPAIIFLMFCSHFGCFLTSHVASREWKSSVFRDGKLKPVTLLILELTMKCSQISS